MIRFSKLADYAVVILASLYQRQTGLMSASEISSLSGLPEPTVAKVLKLLSKAALVVSIRGAQGGYKITRSADEISVAQVVVAVDGPVSLTACVEGGSYGCEYSCGCPVKGRWDTVNTAVKSALESIALSDMIAPSYQTFGTKEDYKKERVS